MNQEIQRETARSLRSHVRHPQRAATVWTSVVLGLAMITMILGSWAVDTTLRGESWWITTTVLVLLYVAIKDVAVWAARAIQRRLLPECDMCERTAVCSITMGATSNTVSDEAFRAVIEHPELDAPSDVIVVRVPACQRHHSFAVSAAELRLRTLMYERGVVVSPDAWKNVWETSEVVRDDEDRLVLRAPAVPVLARAGNDFFPKHKSEPAPAQPEPEDVEFEDEPDVTAPNRPYVGRRYRGDGPYGG